MIALLLAAAAACPSDQVIGLDIKAWRKALLADRPGSDEQRAEMAALRVKTVPEGAEGDDDCYAKPLVEGVDVFDANLTGAHDKLIQVRFRMCRGTPQEWQSLRIAVLAPLPEGKFCLLDGEDLSVDRSVKNRLCDKPGKLPMTLAFRELVEKGKNVVETRDEQGSCEAPHMENVMLALYQAQGWSLAKIFDTVIFDSHATSSGAGFTQTTTVTYGKALPKEIHLERCVSGTCEGEDYVWKSGKYAGR